MINFKDKSGRDINVRQLEVQDSEKLLQYYKKTSHIINMNERFSGILTEDAVREHIEASRKDSEKCLFLAIETAGEIIGFIRFDRLEGAFCKSAEISFGLLYDYWKNNILEIAISELVKFVFIHFDLARIFYENYSRNLGAGYILLDCGFKKDGILRSCAYNSGVMSDATIFSLLFSEVSLTEKAKITR